MDFNCEIKNHIIHLTFKGEINNAIYPLLSEEGYTQIKTHRANVLWHLEDTHLNVSLTELHLLQSQFPNKTSPNVGVYRIAALVNPNDMEKWIFAENVSVNFGYQRKVFLNEAQALNWLTNKA